MTDAMTSKERASWRAQANSLEPLFQVGKGGISDALIQQTEDALKARELIKIKVLLETSPEPPKAIAAQIAAATNAHVIQVVGGSMVFYRYNPELHKAKKPVKKPGKKIFKTAASKKYGKDSKPSYKRDDRKDKNGKSSFKNDDKRVTFKKK